MQCVFLTADMLFPSRVLAVAQAMGVRLRIVPAASQLAQHLTDDCRLVLIDLETPGLELARLMGLVRDRAAAARVIAFGPHVEEATLEQARAVGCDQVLSRGQFQKQYGELLQLATDETNS